MPPRVPTADMTREELRAEVLQLRATVDAAAGRPPENRQNAGMNGKRAIEWPDDVDAQAVSRESATLLLDVQREQHRELFAAWKVLDDKLAALIGWSFAAAAAVSALAKFGDSFGFEHAAAIFSFLTSATIAAAGRSPVDFRGPTNFPKQCRDATEGEPWMAANLAVSFAAANERMRETIARKGVSIAIATWVFIVGVAALGLAAIIQASSD